MREYLSIPLWGRSDGNYVKTCPECGSVVPFAEESQDLHDAWHATLRPDLDTTPDTGYTEGNNETTEV